MALSRLDITDDLLDSINGSWSSETPQSFPGGGDDRGSDWFCTSDCGDLERPPQPQDDEFDRKVKRWRHKLRIISWLAHCDELRREFAGIAPFERDPAAQFDVRGPAGPPDERDPAGPFDDHDPDLVARPGPFDDYDPDLDPDLDPGP